MKNYATIILISMATGFLANCAFIEGTRGQKTVTLPESATVQKTPTTPTTTPTTQQPPTGAPGASASKMIAPITP